MSRTMEFKPATHDTLYSQKPASQAPDPEIAGHSIVVCTSCKHKGTACAPGRKLIARLNKALELAGGLVSDDFEITGVACMAGCDRPCTIAFQASRKATYLFGDIDPDQDIDDLVAFASHYREMDDGWCNASARPGKLRRSTLARVPAAIIVSTVGKVTET